MSLTDVAQATNQIQKYWAPRFTKELRESMLLGALVNKDYQGEIKAEGDTVRVSQINAPVGQLLTIGTDADSFSTEALSTSYVDIVCNKRAVAAYEFTDLVSLQSQLGQSNPEIMESLKYAMANQVNEYLYSLVSPSTSAPDHLINSVTDFNASQLAACRILAAQAKWPNDGRWYALLDPQYMGDIMNAATLTSSDYGAADAPVISGQVALKRFGFNILEDNSRPADSGLLFHPDFMHLVTQSEVQVKISDMHSSKRFGFVMSVDMIFGARLGLSGNVKHLRVLGS